MQTWSGAAEEGWAVEVAHPQADTWIPEISGPTALTGEQPFPEKVWVADAESGCSPLPPFPVSLSPSNFHLIPTLCFSQTPRSNPPSHFLLL